MAVLSLLSLALALACANASARSGVLRCPERPASCTLCPSTGPLWAPSLSIFYDGEPEDHHQEVLGGSLDDPLGKFCQGNSIAIKSLALLTEMYQWDAPSTTVEAPPPESWHDFSDFCSTSRRSLSSTTSPRRGEGVSMVGGLPLPPAGPAAGGQATSSIGV